MSLRREKEKQSKNISPFLGIDVKFDDVEKLQEALESQVDIVLRLEEERLKLLKENKHQKQMIEELSSCKQQTATLQKNQEIQTFHYEQKDEGIQTGEETNSKSSLIEEAMMLVNKHNPKMKSSQIATDSKKESLKQSGMITKRSTTTQMNSSILKENDPSQSQLGNAAPPKISEKEYLTQEIVRLTKESSTFKFQIRTMNETIKKMDKENFELKKNCDVKNETLEKLRREIADLSKILNTDKFKSIKSIENDLFKALSLNKSLQEELISKQKENAFMHDDLNNLRLIIDKLSNDFGNAEQEKKEMENEKLIKNQQKTIEELTTNLKYKEEQLKVKEEGLKDIMIQNENLNEEVEYFKGMAKTSKNHAEKALNDVDFYRNKLMELKNNKTEDH